MILYQAHIIFLRIVKYLTKDVLNHVELHIKDINDDK